MVNSFYISGRTFSADLSAPISLEEALREAVAALTPLAAALISLEEALREAAAFRNYLQTS